MPTWYRLDGHTPVPCYAERGDAFPRRDMQRYRVASDVVETPDGAHLVSTVFLGMDHRFDDDGPPLLFETMAFPSDCVSGVELAMERYATWDEAEAGHKRMVQALRDGHLVSTTGLAVSIPSPTYNVWRKP